MLLDRKRRIFKQEKYLKTVFECSGHSVFNLTLWNLVQIVFLIVGFCFPELLILCSISGLSHHLHGQSQMRSELRV